MASIYGLYDRAGRLRYIGKANDVEARLKRHLSDARRRWTPVYAWIRKYGRPEMRVLEADCADWREAEKRLIREARERGEMLLNLADGGDQPLCTPEALARNGRKLTARIKSDPEFRKFRATKMMFAHALRNGEVMNKTRAKLRYLAGIDPKKYGDWANIPDREENADGSPIAGYA